MLHKYLEEFQVFSLHYEIHIYLYVNSLSLQFSPLSARPSYLLPTHSVQPGLEDVFLTVKCQRNQVKEFSAYKQHHNSKVT